MVPLVRAAQILAARFGAHLAAPYVPGKTQFRDALCAELGVSLADAEILCDSLEQAGMIRFATSKETGPTWRLATDAPAK